MTRVYIFFGCFLSFILVTATASASAQNIDQPRLVSGKSGKKLFFSPTTSEPGDIDRYIQQRHAVLEQIARQDPEALIEAQLSFRHYLRAPSFLKLIQKYPVKVTSLSIGWKDNSGGHDVKPGELIEQALNDAYKGYGDFIAEHYGHAVGDFEAQRSHIVSISDRERTLVFLKDASELKRVYDKHGILLYGTKVKGAAHVLWGLSSDHEVRLIDPMVDPRLSDLDSGQRIKAIAIPIHPSRAEIR